MCVYSLCLRDGAFASIHTYELYLYTYKYMTVFAGVSDFACCYSFVHIYLDTPSVCV